MNHENRSRQGGMLRNNKESMSRGKALTSQEVMQRLGIKRQTFERLREEDDHFIVYRVGRNLRMDEADLEAWTQRQTKVEQAEKGKYLEAIA